MRPLKCSSLGFSFAFASSLLATSVAQSQPSPAPVVKLEYDAQGNVRFVTQGPGVAQFGFRTETSYDRLNRKDLITDAKNGITDVDHDGGDQVTLVTDPRRLPTSYIRTGLGDAVRRVSRDTGTTVQTFDSRGRIESRTDSRNVLSTYVHDSADRLRRVTYTKAGEAAQQFAWNYDEPFGLEWNNGFLTSTTYPAGTSNFGHDRQRRLVQHKQRLNPLSGSNARAVEHTVSYEYDVADNLTAIVYPSGRRVSFTYADGVATGIKLAKDSASNPEPLVSGIRYAPFGAVERWTLHFAQTTRVDERTQDEWGRPERYRLGAFTRTVSYDAADRISGYSHVDASTGASSPASQALDQEFGYDELGRLTSVRTATTTWGYGYDANGNRISQTIDGSTRAYTVATNSNRLDSMAGGRSFQYDEAGSTRLDSGIGYSATYDLSGRLDTLTKDGVTYYYSHNAFGQRVRKHSNQGSGSTLIFLYDHNGNLLGEYDEAGAAVQEYIWFGGVPVATFMANPAVRDNTPVVYHIGTDHLGTPRVMEDRTETTVWRWHSEPFGTAAAEYSSTVRNWRKNTLLLRFPGQYFDRESGLHYNYFRDYDSSIGRYAQSDPIGLDGGINTYAYVSGNPLSQADPKGLFNPAKGASALGNAAIAGFAAGSGGQKLAAAIGLAPTATSGIGALPPSALAAWGLWNLKASKAAWDRARQQWGEAMCEKFSDASWKNLMGMLPGGTHYDDPGEYDGPLDYIRNRGVWEFIKDAGYF